MVTSSVIVRCPAMSICELPRRHECAVGSPQRRARRHERSQVVDWCTETDVHLSVIVLGEIRRGIERKRHRNDIVQANALEAWLGRLEATFADRIVPVDAAVADFWGRLQVPGPRPVVDALIAATALVHGLTVVTRNVHDFTGTGVRVLAPFAA